MNILLINPPRSPANAILDHAPAEARRFIHKKLIGPPLGLLTIAAAIKHHSVQLLDMKGEYDLHPDAPGIEELTIGWLKKSTPDIVGVTFIASEFNAGMQIFRTVKKHNPRILTVAGGLHANVCPEDFADPSVDIVIQGQAAPVFRSLVDAVARKADIDSVAGIIIKKNKALTPTAPGPEIDAAGKDFILPDRSLIQPWLSTYRVGDAPGPVTYLFTSLGCPYRCIFCSIWPQFKGRFYQRPIESIVDELKTLDEYPVVRFADANTVIAPSLTDSLFSRMQEEGIRKEYVMDIRFDTVVKHPALIEKMARNGLKVVICGFESFRQADLDYWGKSAPASLIREAISILDRNGIRVRGNYVIPPDYTDADFDALEKYAASYPVAYAGYTILTPMPGTPLFESMQNEIIDRDLSHYNFFNCVLKTSLPMDHFYRRIGSLWTIRKGSDVI